MSLLNASIHSSLFIMPRQTRNYTEHCWQFPSTHWNLSTLLNRPCNCPSAKHCSSLSTTNSTQPVAFSQSSRSNTFRHKFIWLFGYGVKTHIYLSHFCWLDWLLFFCCCHCVLLRLLVVILTGRCGLPFCAYWRTPIRGRPQLFSGR